MKKLSLNQLKQSTEVLTREQLKKVIGGELASGSGGGCQERGSLCSTYNGINCCTGLVCADNTCWKGTF